MEELNRETSHFHYERINVGVTTTVKTAIEAGVKRLVFLVPLLSMGIVTGRF